MAVRAKFSCTRKHAVWFQNPEIPSSNPQISYEFQAVYDTSTPENERFTKHTPSGQLTVTVDNPGVSFIPGKAYYLDFTEAD